MGNRRDRVIKIIKIIRLSLASLVLSTRIEIEMYTVATPLVMIYFDRKKNALEPAPSMPR